LTLRPILPDSAVLQLQKENNEEYFCR
jgi:hypothetical protein